MSESYQQKVLALLAKEWDLKGPPGILDVSDIVAAVPLAPSDALAALKALFEAGLVDMNELKTVSPTSRRKAVMPPATAATKFYFSHHYFAFPPALM